MKNIKNYSIAVAAALSLGLTSCGEDFLTEEPATKLGIDGYYNTEAHIMESLVAAYDPLQWYDYFGGWAPLNIVWDCMGDDLYVGGGSTTDQGQLHKISQYKADPNDNIGGLWSANYSGINRSIRLIDNATASELSNKELLIAEGRVMRAWYYLVLWKTWGNIPLYMENLTFPYIAEQKSASEVYNVIAADLEEVLDSKVLPMKYTGEWAGRMTQASAAMIYADYVMYQQDQSKYSKALGYMKDIINSGQYSLAQDYDDLFDYTKEWCNEIIFDINYCANGGKRDWGNANATGGTVLPELIGIDGLNYENGKQTIHGPYAEFSTGGWGFAAISKEVYDAFEPGDIRRDVALLNMADYIPLMAEQGVTVTYGGRYQNTGIFLRKYLGREGGRDGQQAASGLNWDNNLHIYRYAETLLNAAELALATGDASAQGYFDQVRQRAGLGTKTVSKENILAERRVEFVGEGKRYFDLVRTGMATTYLKKGAGVVLQDKATGTYGGQAIPERENWTEKKKYITIPQGEIDAASGTLVQNDYN